MGLICSTVFPRPAAEPNITFKHCSVIVSTHPEFCPDIAEFCLVKNFSASFMTLNYVCTLNCYDIYVEKCTTVYTVGV